MKDKKQEAGSKKQEAGSKKQEKPFRFIKRDEPIFERLKVPSNVIYLVKREDRWYTLSDFPDKVLALLGTNELATPYAASVKADVVYKYVQQTNLDKFVMVMV